MTPFSSAAPSSSVNPFGPPASVPGQFSQAGAVPASSPASGFGAFPPASQGFAQFPPATNGFGTSVAANGGFGASAGFSQQPFVPQQQPAGWGVPSAAQPVANPFMVSLWCVSCACSYIFIVYVVGPLVR